MRHVNTPSSPLATLQMEISTRQKVPERPMPSEQWTSIGLSSVRALCTLLRDTERWAEDAEGRQAVLTVHGTLPQYSNSVQCSIIQYVCIVIVVEGENLTDKHYTTNKMVITFSRTVPYLRVRVYARTYIRMYA